MWLHCPGYVLEEAAETIMAISGPYLIECHQNASASVAKCLKIRHVEIATRTLCSVDVKIKTEKRAVL